MRAFRASRSAIRFLRGGFVGSALVVAAMLALGGCGGSGEKSAGGGDGEKQYRIAVIPKGASHQFWQSVRYGAEQAAEELGTVEVVWQSPAIESDTRKQIELVEQMILQQVDGIVLAPNHQVSLVDAVAQANDAGIPVIIFDSGLDEGAEIVSYVATDNRNGGKKAARRLAEVMGDEGEVILLRYKEGSESTLQREEGFLEEMAQHPNITLVSSDQYGGDSVSTAKTKVEQLLLAHPNARGLFAVCESNANGALEAILDSGRGDAIHFVAFDPSERLIDALKSGDCDGIVLQNPVAMGHESVMAMVRHLEGQKVESNVPTGEEVATVENMEEPRMQSLLNPPISR